MRKAFMTRRRFLGSAAALGGFAALGLMLPGCAQQQEQQAQTKPEQQQEPQSGSATTEGQQAGSASTEGTGAKVLVVYFSAQGHTRKVAEAAADALGADIFEVVPAEPYSDADLDYNDETCRVYREYEDESLRSVELETAEIPNWDTYETVFIGYPIWWGGAAWPMTSFASVLDFEGKTVVPFCTSASSPMGSSASEVSNGAAGTWLEGQRFSSSASAAKVASWVEGLEL